MVDLALGLKSAIMLLNPARIVIGGGISKAGDLLLFRYAPNYEGRSRIGRARESTLFPPHWRMTAYSTEHSL